jgi:hypothetical protein
MTRSPNQDTRDPRSLWPLVRLFGILTDIAAQQVATRQEVETAAPLEVGADLLAGDTSVLTDSGEDRSEQEAA